MIQLYFRDVRRRVQRLEDRYLPKPSGEFQISWVDDDGTVTMIAGPGRLWERDEDETESEENHGWTQIKRDKIPAAFRRLSRRSRALRPALEGRLPAPPKPSVLSPLERASRNG